jgi:hypothetical protein
VTTANASEPNAAALAATLHATIDNLETHIQQRAGQLAAPRIAAAEQAATDRIAKLETEHARERQRLEDLLAEMRRQIKQILAERDRGLHLAYAARHLPQAVRALPPPLAVWTRHTPPPGVDQGWCQQIDRAVQQPATGPEAR